eukprot:TRINITY_DN11586_c0_g1_i2.p1 TRINITY_DN11586_c0_g1~~TRINITY_DN11586_c0_g1_i2.p1  ORF type:complete len:190 (-),score=26.55 TRINITY_DN11586_c0_g1_i2:35-604(-)
MVRFLELAAQSHQEGDKAVLDQFKEAVLSSSKLFQNIRRECMKSVNMEAFKAFIEELLKELAAKNGPVNLAALLNGNSEACNALTQLIFGKHCEEICNFLNVPIGFVQPGEYKVLKEYTPKSFILDPEKVIYLYHQDDANSCMFYNKGRVDLAVLDPMPKVRLPRHSASKDTFTPVSYTHLTLPTICSV